MRHWSTALTHEDSVLIGFDSFEGLPEGFDDRLGYSIGAFDAHGEVPVIDDPRVSFVRGLFEETLPTFRVPPHTKLVINLDADLYSSSMAALRALSDYIVPGTVLFFDDFAHLEHEPRAFADFIATTGKEFDLLCTERNLSRPAFVCVDGSGNTHTRSRRDHAQPFGIVE